MASSLTNLRRGSRSAWKIGMRRLQLETEILMRGCPVLFNPYRILLPRAVQGLKEEAPLWRRLLPHHLLLRAQQAYQSRL